MRTPGRSAWRTSCATCASSALKKPGFRRGPWLHADDKYRGLGVGGDDEDGDDGAVAGGEGQQVRRRAGQELPRGPGADQEAHDQAEVVARHVHEVALLQVLAAAQPGPAHAAPVEDQREAPLDQLGPEPERLLGHPRAQPGAVVVHRSSGLGIAAPAADACRLLLGDAALPGPVLQVLQPVTGVVALTWGLSCQLVRLMATTGTGSDRTGTGRLSP